LISATVTSQPSCIFNCLIPIGLADPSGCDDVTNACACLSAPALALNVITECIKSVCMSSTSAYAGIATSLYESYCVSIYGTAEFTSAFSAEAMAAASSSTANVKVTTSSTSRTVKTSTSVSTAKSDSKMLSTFTTTINNSVVIVTSTGTTNSTASSTAVQSESASGISPGAIAGIAIGSVLGLLALLSFVAFIVLKTRHARKTGHSPDRFQREKDGKPEELDGNPRSELAANKSEKLNSGVIPNVETENSGIEIQGEEAITDAQTSPRGVPPPIPHISHPYRGRAVELE